MMHLSSVLWSRVGNESNWRRRMALLLTLEQRISHTNQVETLIRLRGDAGKGWIVLCARRCEKINWKGKEKKHKTWSCWINVQCNEPCFRFLSVQCPSTLTRQNQKEDEEKDFLISNIEQVDVKEISCSYCCVLRLLPLLLLLLPCICTSQHHPPPSSDAQQRMKSHQQ